MVDLKMYVIMLKKKEQEQQKKILLENCSDYFEELAAYAVYLKEESRSDILEYIEQNLDQPRHCKEIFEKQPAKVMQMIAKKEGVSSYTELCLIQCGISSLLNENPTKKNATEEKVEGITGKKGTKLKIDYYPVEAIELPRMEIKQEPFKQLVNQIGQEIGSTVIPISFFNYYIRQAVEKEEEQGGIPPFLFLKEVRAEVIEGFKASIMQSLSLTGYYQKSLLDMLQWNGEKFATLQLSKQEWSMLCSLFRMYHACIYQTEQGDFLLTVGMKDE